VGEGGHLSGRHAEGYTVGVWNGNESRLSRASPRRLARKKHNTRHTNEILLVTQFIFQFPIQEMSIVLTYRIPIGAQIARAPARQGPGREPLLLPYPTDSRLFCPMPE